MSGPDLYHTRKFLPELIELEAILDEGHQWIRADVIEEIQVPQRKLPIYVLEMGSDLPDAPVLGLFGGVHGIERIGCQVILSFLRTLVERLKWDPWIHEQLAQVRLVVMPMVNPGGMWQNSRCNPNGVDLMRNAPISAMDKVPFLIGGQRISRLLPWYRGKRDTMEVEAMALCDTVRKRLLTQSFSISLDCHSGFGAKDRLWIPYARTFKPIKDIDLAFKLKNLFFNSYPQHSFYWFEPQSQSYTTHGDLWDYLYDENQDIYKKTFLPLTLEMGSWLWVKKNPRQLFSFFSLFNPVLPHRHSRILRRHNTLFEFLMSACRAHHNWVDKDPTTRNRLTKEALAFWYSDPA